MKPATPPCDDGIHTRPKRRSGQPLKREGAG